MNFIKLFEHYDSPKYFLIETEEELYNWRKRHTPQNISDEDIEIIQSHLKKPLLHIEYSKIISFEADYLLFKYYRPDGDEELMVIDKYQDDWWVVSLKILAKSWVCDEMEGLLSVLENEETFLNKYFKR